MSQGDVSLKVLCAAEPIKRYFDDVAHLLLLGQAIQVANHFPKYGVSIPIHVHHSLALDNSSMDAFVVTTYSRLLFITFAWFRTRQREGVQSGIRFPVERCKAVRNVSWVLPVSIS